MIVILGTATVVLSVWVACKFRQHARNLNNTSHKLTRALMWQLIGEALLGLGTLAFAVMAYLEMLPDIPVQVQSAMRLLMFAASSITTVHLYLTTSKMNK